jgi:hypothetical protein
MDYSPARILSLAWFIVTPCLHASAPNVYIAQSPSGVVDGTSCANALSVNWFNTNGNWGTGAAQIGPGTTVHLCGTITGTANSTILTVYGSGTSGNPITIRWEIGASVTSPACSSSSGCFNTNGHSYIVVDGNGTSPSITSTNNGSPAGGFGYSVWAVGISAKGCSQCEFRNLTITNMYVFTDHSNDHSAGGTGISVNSSSNTSVHNCSFDQMNGPISDAFGNGDSGNSFYANTFNHFNHGIEIGNNNTNVVSNFRIYGNNFQSMSNWDDAANDYHHDGVLFYQNTSAPDSIRGFYIYNNLFTGDMGNNATAWIYFNSGLNGIYIFNNLFFNSNGRPASLIEAGYNQTSQDQNLYVYNNYGNCNKGTIALNLAGFNNISVENNAWEACQIYLYGNNNVSLGTGVIDHNLYAGASRTNDALFKWESQYISLAQLQAAGIDVNSLTPASAGADSSGVPQPGSSMIHDGMKNFLNLSSSCAGGLVPLCSDYAGNPRANTGVNTWDAGAYNVSSEPQAGDRPIAPTSLSTVVR